MRNKLIHFMQGRYGQDALNQMLVWLSLLLVFLGLFPALRFLTFVGLLVLIVTYFRMFSKNIPQRYQENQKYLRYRRKVRSHLQRIQKFVTHKYLKCPNCQKTTRVPRGKGEITVTCPYCQIKFGAKS